MSVVAFIPLVYVEHPLLSSREREVAAWLSTPNRLAPAVIAGHLKISRRTVEKHIQNIYGKLHINQRDQLVRLVRESIEPRRRVEIKPARLRRRA
jgi:DNA-binding CsgD family transcriptional regulator